MIKKPFGKVLLEQSKSMTFDADITGATRAMAPSLMKEIHTIAANKSKEYPYIGKDFYICFTFTIDWFLLGIFKKDPANWEPTTRVYIGPVPTKPKVWVRQSCPTPIFKMGVFKYHHISGEVEFLWVLPPKWRYEKIVADKQQYLADKDYAGVAKFVLLDADGSLLQWVKKENGELDGKIGNVVIKNNKPA